MTQRTTPTAQLPDCRYRCECIDGHRKPRTDEHGWYCGQCGRPIYDLRRERMMRRLDSRIPGILAAVLAGACILVFMAWVIWWASQE